MPEGILSATVTLLENGVTATVRQLLGPPTGVAWLVNTNEFINALYRNVFYLVLAGRKCPDRGQTRIRRVPLQIAAAKVSYRTQMPGLACASQGRMHGNFIGSDTLLYDIRIVLVARVLKYPDTTISEVSLLTFKDAATTPPYSCKSSVHVFCHSSVCFFTRSRCRAGVRRILGNSPVWLRYVNSPLHSPIVPGRPTLVMQGHRRGCHSPGPLYGEVRPQGP